MKTLGFKGCSSSQADLAAAWGEALAWQAPPKLVARLGRARGVQASSLSPLIIRQALPSAGSVGWLS